MVCSGSLEVRVQGEVVSAEMAGSPEEMPKVVGVITSRTRARRGSGDWIEIARKHRAFIPDGLSVPSVGEVGECWGRVIANGPDPFLMVSRIRSRRFEACASSSELLGVLGLRRSPPRQVLMVFQLLGPLVEWLCCAGWKAVARKLVKGTLRSVQAIVADPFILYRRRGLPFQAAVAAAQVLGHDLYSDEHYKAAVMEALAQADEEGIGGISEAHLVARCAELIGLPADRVAPSITLQAGRAGKCEQGLWFSPGVYFVRKKALAMIRANQQDSGNASPSVQARALRYRYTVVTGGAGSGKTELARSLSAQVRERGGTVAATAMTGKAATLLGEDATTLHKLLGYGGGGYLVSSVGADLVLVDEAGMLTWHILYRLLLSCRGQIVLIGDPAQLAPVGATPVMAELLTVLPVVHLGEEGSKGSLLVKVQVIRFASEALLLHQLRKVVCGYQDTGVEWQALSPVYAGGLGVDRLNRLLQEIVNPDGLPCHGGFRTGDRVIVTKTRYDGGQRAVNGEQGRVLGGMGDTIALRLDSGREVALRADELQLSYCITVHKAQGSRYQCVVFIIPERECGAFAVEERMQYVGRTRGREATVCMVY